MSPVSSTRSASDMFETKATVSGLTGEGGETGRNGELVEFEVFVIVLEEVVDIDGLVTFGRRGSPEALAPLGDGGGCRSRLAGCNGGLARKEWKSSAFSSSRVGP